MTEAACQVWDGIRPLSKRDIVSSRRLDVAGLGLLSSTENLADPTDWCFEEKHHTIVVHLAGRLDRMECAFSHGPSGHALPLPGDIWMIPADCRYAAIAQGDSARFLEISVPGELLVRPLAARVRHRDPFLHAAAERLAELMARQDDGDDLGAMAVRAIAEALKIHLLERYGRSPNPMRRRKLTRADCDALRDAIDAQLEADHTLSSLAGLVDMDVRGFTAAFRRAFGSTPWQYVLKTRLGEGARLLATTMQPVTDIALSVGFSTPSHFATAFARRYGASPSRYRALLGGRGAE